MKGVVKLHIHRRFRHTERYRNMEERDGIIRRWIADFNLVTKPHYITIVPDEEEIALQYDIERIKRFASGKGKYGDYPGDRGVREIKEAI